MMISVVLLIAFVAILIAVAIIDIKTMIIPDGLLILATLAGLFWICLPNSLSVQDAIIGVFVGALPLLILNGFTWLVAKKPGFGYGDVKLMAVAGLFIGWQGMPIAYFVAFVTGGIFGVYLLLTGRAERGAYLAFGPFLCLGIVVSLAFSLICQL